MKLVHFLATLMGMLLLCTLFTPYAHAEENQTQKVGTSTLKVRSEPSIDAEVIGQLEDGDSIAVFETKYDWAKTYMNGEVGWVASQYLYPVNNQETEEEKVTVVEDSQPENRSSNSLEGRTIVLDPGHGGKDPGAIGFDDTNEKNLTLATTEKIADHLQDTGANVIMTRNDDSFLSLEERVQTSNNANTDAFISLHYNAFPISTVGGIHTYHYTNGDDRDFAQSLQQGLSEQVRLEDKGALQGDYHVLRENRDLAALVELGFLTNPNELAIIQSESYKANVAQGITEGVQQYFNE